MTPKFKVGDVVYLSCVSNAQEREVIEIDLRRGTDIYLLGYWYEDSFGEPGMRTSWTEEKFIMTKEQAVVWRLKGGSTIPFVHLRLFRCGTCGDYVLCSFVDNQELQELREDKHLSKEEAVALILAGLKRVPFTDCLACAAGWRSKEGRA